MLNLVSKFFLPCLALVASVSPSLAIPVSYNTTGSSFTCNGPGLGTAASPTCVASAVAGVPGGAELKLSTGSGLNTNSATLRYTAINPDLVIDAEPGPNFSTFGTFSWTGNTKVPLGVGNPTPSNLADFTLRITQSLPTSAGPGSVGSDLIGRIRLKPTPSGGMFINFFGGSITLDSVVYTPNNTTINSNPLPTFTDLGGNIDASAVPEPGFYGLLSLGMAGLYAAVKRRRTATV